MYCPLCQTAHKRQEISLFIEFISLSPSLTHLPYAMNNLKRGMNSRSCYRMPSPSLSPFHPQSDSSNVFTVLHPCPLSPSPPPPQFLCGSWSLRHIPLQGVCLATGITNYIIVISHHFQCHNDTQWKEGNTIQMSTRTVLGCPSMSL